MSEVLFFRVHFHFFAHCHHNVLGSRYEVELQFKRRREMSEVVRKLRYNLNAQQPCRCSAPFMKKLGHLNQSWWGNMGGHRPKPKLLITSLVLHTDLTLSTADMTMVNFSNTLERLSTCVYLRLSIDSIMLCLYRHRNKQWIWTVSIICFLVRLNNS